MATVRTVRVKPGGTVGVDCEYTTLQAAINGEKVSHSNLVSLDERLDIACYAGDIGICDITSANFTTDVSHYIRIYAVGGQGHSGKWDDTKCRIVNTSLSGAAITTDWVQSYTRIEGLQIKVTASATNIATGIAIHTGQVDDCIVVLEGNGTTTNRAITATNSAIRNCVVYGTGTQSTNSRGVYLSGTTTLENCTVANIAPTNNGGILTFAAGTTTVKNCIASGNTIDYYGTYSASSTNNSASNGTAPGSNPRSGTPTYTNAATGDFSLSSSDTVARAKGIDLSADSTWLSFTDTSASDIAGTPRAGLWDIGAFAVIPVSNDKAHTVSSVVSVDQSKSHTVSSVVVVDQSKSHSANAVVSITPDKTHTVGAYVQVDGTRSHTVSMVVQTQNTERSHTANVVVQKLTDVGHTANLTVQTSSANTHVVDVVISCEKAISHTVDMCVIVVGQTTQYLKHTVDMVVRMLTSPTATVDLNEYTTEAVGGTAEFRLVGYDKLIPSTLQAVITNPTIKATADETGVIRQVLIGNDCITPDGTTYEVTLYNGNGGWISTKRYRFTGNGTFDLNAIAGL